MLRFLCVVLGMAPLLILCQTHEIVDHDLYIEGVVDDIDVSANTHFNALDSVTVDWSIVEANVPDAWDFSFCFPNCHAIGVTEGTNAFAAESEHYLNCHVYPNGVSGSGQLSMQLTTNRSIVDTVTWWVTIDAINPVFSSAAQTLLAFPNPFSSVLTVRGVPNGATIDWFNAEGKRVQQVPSADGSELHVTGFNPGVFTMMVTLDNQIVDVRRVVSK